MGALAVGKKLYKGWVHGARDGPHRAYPVLHANIPSPLVNSFMVYLEVDYSSMGENWIHLASWGNNIAWYVFTMSVRNRKLEMAHLHWRWIGPQPQPDFPVGKWVRITAYTHFTSGSLSRRCTARSQSAARALGHVRALARLQPGAAHAVFPRRALGTSLTGQSLWRHARPG